MKPSSEVLHPPGEGVQFTPFGLYALDTATPGGGGADANGASVPRPVQGEDAHQRMSMPPDRGGVVTSREPTRAPAAPISASSPGSVIRQAKARIKELRAFLREAKKADKELRELERLVAAAKKPLAPVRDIRRSAS